MTITNYADLKAYYKEVKSLVDECTKPRPENNHHGRKCLTTNQMLILELYRKLGDALQPNGDK